MSEDPYRPATPFPPPSQFPPAFPGDPNSAKPPGQIKVFGILHLVFAGLGLVMQLFSVLMRGVNENLYAAQEKMGGQQAMQARLSRQMGQSMESITWFQFGIAVILSTLLILGGIGLLKSRASGLKWSITYAWTAIALRVLTVVVCLVVVLPKMNAAMEGMVHGMGGSGGKVEETTLAVVKGSMMVGLVLGPLFYCIYPVLVLLLLSRKKVGPWLI